MYVPHKGNCMKKNSLQQASLKYNPPKKHNNKSESLSIKDVSQTAEAALIGSPLTPLLPHPLLTPTPSSQPAPGDSGPCGGLASDQTRLQSV